MRYIYNIKDRERSLSSVFYVYEGFIDYGVTDLRAVRSRPHSQRAPRPKRMTTKLSNPPRKLGMSGKDNRAITATVMSTPITIGQNRCSARGELARARNHFPSAWPKTIFATNDVTSTKPRIKANNARIPSQTMVPANPPSVNAPK